MIDINQSYKENMQASRRGAVYWATLAFGGVFLGGTMGGEVVYYKYFKRERDVDIIEVSIAKILTN